MLCLCTFFHCINFPQSRYHHTINFHITCSFVAPENQSTTTKQHHCPCTPTGYCSFFHENSFMYRFSPRQPKNVLMPSMEKKKAGDGGMDV